MTDEAKEAFRHGYETGYTNGLNIAKKILNSKDEAIRQIEQIRDLDKNVGEYPYNRCIKIIKEVIGNERPR